MYACFELKTYLSVDEGAAIALATESETAKGEKEGGTRLAAELHVAAA